MSGASHILFNAGGLALAADSCSIACIHDGLKVQSEEHTSEWFLGLAVADERLLPVTDLGAYLNGKPSIGRIMELTREFGIAGLRIDDVQGVSQKQPEPQDFAQVENKSASSFKSDSSLTNMVINDLGQCYRLIDIVHLLQSNRFLNVQHEPAEV